MSKLIYETETYGIMGAAFRVHRLLGPGFLERVYHEAMLHELHQRKIPYQSQVTIPVFYDGIELPGTYIADIICYDAIILELKAITGLTTREQGQLLNYLRATKLQLGLLLNFGAQSLQSKRVTNFPDDASAGNIHGNFLRKN